MLIGWFTRIVVIFAVVGVVGFDGVSLVAGHVGADQDANDAASAAASAWQTSHTSPASYAAAEQAAATSLSHGEQLVPGSFHIGADGSVTLRVHRQVDHTLVAHDLGFLKHEVTFDTAGSAPAPTS